MEEINFNFWYADDNTFIGADEEEIAALIAHKGATVPTWWKQKYWMFIELGSIEGF